MYCWINILSQLLSTAIIQFAFISGWQTSRGWICVHLFLCPNRALSPLNAPLHSQRGRLTALRMPLYLAWFTISLSSKGQCEGKRFIKDPSLCFREVRRGHGNTDWHTDMCLSHPPDPSQKLSAPFPPSHVHWIAQRRCCSGIAGCPGFSCCANTLPGLLAAPGGSSLHPLMTSLLTLPAT